MPENNPLHFCTEEKPELYQPVRLYFEDEWEATGQWTGRSWWSRGHEVAPLGWQYVELPAQAEKHALHGFRN